MSDPDYILDIQGLRPPEGEAAPQGADPPSERSAGAFPGRPWLAVRWRCCSVYSRVYRNRQGDAYEGRCPRCGRPVRARIGAGGTNARFFEAG